MRRRDGTLVARDEEAEAHWSLNALAQAAKEAGIAVKRSHIRTILVREGVRLPSHPQLGNGSRQGLRPKRTAVVTHYTQPPDGSTTSHAPTNSAP